MPVPRAERLVALDAFRGLTVAAMILVNNPGESAAVYRPLQHADWNGCTPTDLIFPFFLFITGVAIPFSLASTPGEGRAAVYARIARRALVVFALGIFLNWFPLFDWSTLRLPGVLQRVAICYGCASLLAVELSIALQACAAVLLVAGYWLLMTQVPVPHVGRGMLMPDANLAAFVDNRLLHGHLLHETWDPEGLLTTIPAIATTLWGTLTGHWLRWQRPAREHVHGLMLAGGLGLAAGCVMDRVWPLNKNLWSGSFVFFTAGAALAVLGGCYWLSEVRGWRRWAAPFLAYGSNPIVAYVLSVLVAKLLYLWRITRPDGSMTYAGHYLFETVFLRFATPLDASLLYAVAYALVWLLVTTFLYRRRVLIKI